MSKRCRKGMVIPDYLVSLCTKAVPKFRTDIVEIGYDGSGIVGLIGQGDQQ